jgi:hypothetical protein
VGKLIARSGKPPLGGRGAELVAHLPAAPHTVTAAADLVFIQNGMLQPWLDARGLGEATQVGGSGLASRAGQPANAHLAGLACLMLLPNKTAAAAAAAAVQCCAACPACAAPLRGSSAHPW